MKLDFSSDNSAVSLVEKDLSQNGSAAEGTETLRAGIKAAQRGDRAEARQLLLRVTESDPHNESAWLWLASISEYPEELLIFLNNVLDINPENERAIEWAKATKSLLAKTFVQRGIEAQNSDQTQFARQCFMQAIVHDNRNEMAWLWLASVTDASEEKIAHMHRVLEINPQNETARDSIRSTREKMLLTALEKAEAAAGEDDRERAEKYLKEVFELNPQNERGWFLKSKMTESFDEKMACFEKMLEFDPKNETAREAVQKARSERAKEFFENANAAANDGDRGQANELLAEVFVQNPHYEDAWVLKSRMTDSFEEKIACFEKILEFNPENETAQAGVKLRAMLNGGAPRAEDPVILPEEETFEEFGAAEFEDQTENAHAASEESSHLVEDSAVREFAEPVEIIEEPAVFEAEEKDMLSASDETEQFSYFAEQEEAEKAESFDSAEAGEFDNESSAEFVESPAGDNYPEYAYSEVEVAEEKEAAAETEEVAAEFTEELTEDFAGEGREEENSHGEKFFAGDYEAETAETFQPAEMSENGFHAEMTEAESFSQAESNRDTDGEHSNKLQGELKTCPFCAEDNELQAFICHSCRSLLTLSDMEMILAYQEAEEETLRKSVERMEVEDIRRGLESAELVTLAIGHINLKNLRKGLECLQKAAKLDPNNVVVDSQANSLAIRLAEIEQQENAHSAMPKDRTIMVVDDSATVRKLISGKLEKCGHIVITAVDGMDAMTKLNDVVPDLILLDITMPRMDGYQVCKLIRSSDATKEVPIVMISGKDGFFDKVRGRMAGTTGYITKPFGPETLMKMLDTYLV